MTSQMLVIIGSALFLALAMFGTLRAWWTLSKRLAEQRADTEAKHQQAENERQDKADAAARRRLDQQHEHDRKLLATQAELLKRMTERYEDFVRGLRKQDQAIQAKMLEGFEELSERQQHVLLTMLETLFLTNPSGRHVTPAKDEGAGAPPDSQEASPKEGHEAAPPPDSEDEPQQDTVSGEPEPETEEPSTLVITPVAKPPAAADSTKPAPLGPVWPPTELTNTADRTTARA